MELQEAIRSRRAVRDYRRDPPSEAQIRQIIAAALWAPRAMNNQSWRFTVVTDGELLDCISVRAKAWSRHAMAHMPRGDHFRDLMDDPQFHLFYQAPALIVVSTADESPWALEESAAAAQLMMLSATGLGLGSCWIGFAQGWLNSAEGLQTLNLPAASVIGAPVIVGHIRSAAPPQPRRRPMINWIGELP